LRHLLCQAYLVLIAALLGLFCISCDEQTLDEILKYAMSIRNADFKEACA